MSAGKAHLPDRQMGAHGWAWGLKVDVSTARHHLAR